MTKAKVAKVVAGEARVAKAGPVKAAQLAFQPATETEAGE